MGVGELAAFSVFKSMLRAILCLLPVLLVVAGCSGQKALATEGASKVDQEKQLYDQLKSARYQIGVAADRLNETINLTRGLAQGEEAEVRKALDDIAAGLAAAGSKIADFDEELPVFDKFKLQFSEQDEDRLKAIDACNASLAEIKDQLELMGDLLDSGPPEEESKALNAMKTATEEARDALEDAIQDMDGQVQ